MAHIINFVGSGGADNAATNLATGGGLYHARTDKAPFSGDNPCQRHHLRYSALHGRHRWPASDAQYFPGQMPVSAGMVRQGAGCDQEHPTLLAIYRRFGAPLHRHAVGAFAPVLPTSIDPQLGTASLTIGHLLQAKAIVASGGTADRRKGDMAGCFQGRNRLPTGRRAAYGQRPT